MRRFGGHTSLETLELGPDERGLMNDLWIESVEELVALRAAVGGVNDMALQVGPVLASFGRVEVAFSAPGAYQEFQAPVPLGPLGYVLDDEAEQRNRDMFASGMAAARGVFHAEVPTSVRLMDKMPPVRDQGHRGTCVAFGVGALREYLAGGKVDLSEQFLYWACKEMDGKPNLPGTWLHIAMGALEKLGVCREEAWPYNPSPGSTEGQGPPPAGAKDDAKRYRLSAGRPVAPNQVMHFKHVLAGADGVPPMPVTIGTLVFRSWARSRATYLTGKITMPLPGERYVGGHAWCAVGYVDDESVPGGGYFIVRNSWGPSWAAQSPETAGHALMPYAYVEQYCREAFTGPADHTPAVDDVPDDLKPYVRTLERDGEDLGHALLERGTRVLFNHHDWESYRQDTDANRAAFRRNGYVWTSEARDRTWFPELGDMDPTSARHLDEARRRSTTFRTTGERSVARLRGRSYPPLHPLPWWWTLRARQVRIRRSPEVLAELSQKLLEHEVATGNVPSDVNWPETWKTLIGDMAHLTVHGVEASGARIHVVTAHAPGLRFERARQPRFEGGSATTLQFVKATVESWARTQSRRALFTVYVFSGSVTDVESRLDDFGRDYAVIEFVSDGRSGLRARVPAASHARPAARRFLEALAPPDRGASASDAVKAQIDELRESRVGGNIMLDAVARRAAVPMATARAIVHQLSETGDYVLYRTKAGDFAVGSSDQVRALGVRVVRPEAESPRRALLRLGLHIPTLVCGALLAYEFAASTMIQPMLAGGALLAGYVAEWIYGRAVLGRNEGD